MIFTTKGIVLRTIKYGETSVIATIFTERFGIQSYLMNGVRTEGKNYKAHFFQPSSQLEMQVYHNELKNLQRIKELKWSYLYKNILSDITKNTVALYMVELLQKCLKQPEPNPDLFYFCEDSFCLLDLAGHQVTANFPIYFALHLPHFFGLSIHDNFSTERNSFNVREGNFANFLSSNEQSADPAVSFRISQVLKALQPFELNEIQLDKNTRKAILSVVENYYAFHIPEFGFMKTLPILHELLG